MLKKIDQMCADFFWKGKLHKITWDNLCKPKLEGGVGLWKFSDLNSTPRVELLWNLLTTESLWSRWMQTKYLSKTNFWVLPIDNNYSGTMKSILSQHDLATKIMTWVLINGEHIDLWYDPWINHKSLVDLIGNMVHISNSANNKVSHIIRDWKLQPHLLLKTREVSDFIMQVNLFFDQPADYLRIVQERIYVLKSGMESDSTKRLMRILNWYGITR